MNPVTISGPQSAPPQIFIEPDDTGFATVGLQIYGGASTITGIGGFTGFGSVGMILDSSGGDTVQDCYVGFGQSNGRLVPLNNNEGMLIGGQAPNNIIGGTVAG